MKPVVSDTLMIENSRWCDMGGDNITVMATSDDCLIITEALELLCEPLYRCADRAQERADDHFMQYGMYESEHPGGRAHLARYHLRHLLSMEADLGGWCVNRPRPNGELTLSRESMSLRILRPGPTLQEELPPPPPGPNRARRYYYMNPRLNIFGAEGSNLIAVWAVDRDTDYVEIRIVRPVGLWRVGQYSKVDIDFMMPRLGADLSGFEFVPSDDEIMLPLYDEADFEEGEGDADGADG